MHRHRIAYFCVAFALATAVAATATTLVPQDLSAMIDEAELIFVGSALHSEVVAAEKGAVPVTLVTFAVDETLKGETEYPGEITLLFGGGAIGERGFAFPGMPEFALGDRHLLFVAGNGERLCPIMGWAQGKLDFVAHPETGAELLVDHSGRPVAGAGTREWRVAEPRLLVDGTWRSPVEHGVAILATEGGVVAHEPKAERHAERDLPVAARAIGALRRAIERRSSEPSYRQGARLRSATVSDVPPSLFPSSVLEEVH